MALGDTFKVIRYRETLCRGDSLVAQFALFQNAAADDCAAGIVGDPINLTGYTVAAKAKVIGTGAPVVATAVLRKNGTATEPAEVSLEVSRGNLALAFAEGALRTIDVRIEATRGNDTFTILKGVITMKDSAASVGG